MRCDVCKQIRERIVFIHDGDGRRAVCPDCLRTLTPAEQETALEPASDEPEHEPSAL